MDYWPGERCISLSNQSITNSIISRLDVELGISARQFHLDLESNLKKCYDYKVYEFSCGDSQFIMLV